MPDSESKTQKVATTIFDAIIIKGGAVRKKISDAFDKKKPLEALINEKDTYLEVQKYLLPRQYHVAEEIYLLKHDPNYTTHHHPDYPKSSFLHGFINDFYRAKSALEYSMENGKHYSGWKRQLHQLIEAYDVKYISGENPLQLDNHIATKEHQDFAKQMLRFSFKILKGYEDREAKLKPAYEKARNQAMGQVALSGASTFALAFLAGHLVKGIHLGGKAAEFAVKEGVKKVFGG